jgi:hypothetical protein
MAKKCMKCGGTMKMAKGGSKTCPPGYHISQGSGPCVKDTTVLSGTGVGLGILGGIGAGMAAVGRATSQKAADKKAAKKVVNTATKTLANKKVMKNGGTTKASKFAALAAPKNKITFADKIAGAKKNTKKK